MVIFLTWFSALSFLGYGISCVFTKHMHLEFERFRLVRFRVIVGVTQIAGAVGLLLGLYYPLIGILSAGGLALQMLLGVGVRIAIRDSFLLALPATFYFLLNAYLFIELQRA